MKPLTLLNKYFNTDEQGRRLASIKDFKAEVDDLPDNDKRELALLVAAELGEEVDA